MTRTYPVDAVDVVLLDDDQLLRRRIAAALVDHGYACTEVAGVAEARIALDEADDNGALICDVTRLGESPSAVLAELTADRPDLAVVVLSIADDARVQELAANFVALGVLIKPFDTTELLMSVAGALSRRDLESAQRRHALALEKAIARTRMLGGMLDAFSGAVEEVEDADEGDEETIDRLARAVSLRDEETGRHIQRMSRYAVVLAKAVGFTRIPPNQLRLATALHDVGKIGVADGILLKPGALSLHEYSAMQRHALMGYQLLTGSASELLRIAARIALTHHEWWDGTGYPRGMQGEEIPEEARIAAVADVFDALTSHRVYRPALSFDQAIAMMRELRGSQFEPRLLDAFLDSMPEITMIRKTYPDEDDGEPRIRVLVVDDHEIFAESLVRLLGSRDELKVVGSAGTVAAAVASAVSYQPDVILMDFALPDGEGPDATEQILALNPAVKVVMLTARNDDEALARAIAAGCSGFVKKEDTIESLLAAIVAVHAGETITRPAELASVLRLLRPTKRGLGSDLTRREREILDLLAAGLVNKEIAQRLGVRLNTVRNHVQNLLHKLDAHSKLEAVANAVREGIVTYPQEAAT